MSTWIMWYFAIGSFFGVGVVMWLKRISGLEDVAKIREDEIEEMLQGCRGCDECGGPTAEEEQEIAEGRRAIQEARRKFDNELGYIQKMLETHSFIPIGLAIILTLAWPIVLVYSVSILWNRFMISVESWRLRRHSCSEKNKEEENR